MSRYSVYREPDDSKAVSIMDAYPNGNGSQGIMSVELETHKESLLMAALIVELLNKNQALREERR